MELKKFLWGGLFLSLMTAGFTSCSDDDEDDSWKEGATVELAGTRAFILNEGNMGYNNSNLIYFNWATGEVNTTCIYQQQNGKALGDTGNDICVYDGKLLVAVNGSNYLALLNGSGVELDRISFEDYSNLGAIRNVATYNGYAYVSSYGRYLSKIKIDGNSLTYVDSVKVASCPEGVAVIDGKVYTALGMVEYGKWTYDNRVAVVNANSFNSVSYQDVMTNADNLVAEDGHLFVQGYGASYDYPWGELKDGTYTQLGNATAIAANDGKVYCLYSYTTNWVTYTSTMSVYDISTGKIDSNHFQNIPSSLTNSSTYSISVNPYNDHVYVAATDYKTDGTIYHFDGDGNYVGSFSANGVNTNKIVFLKN